MCFVMVPFWLSVCRKLEKWGNFIIPSTMLDSCIVVGLFLKMLLLLLLLFVNSCSKFENFFSYTIMQEAFPSVLFSWLLPIITHIKIFFINMPFPSINLFLYFCNHRNIFFTHMKEKFSYKSIRFNMERIFLKVNCYKDKIFFRLR